MNKTYDNTNSGALFKNNRREKSTHPEFTGKLNVGGVEYYLNGWRKTPEGRDPFISLSIKKIKPKTDALASGAGAGAAASATAKLDDEVPFAPEFR